MNHGRMWPITERLAAIARVRIKRAARRGRGLVDSPAPKGNPMALTPDDSQERIEQATRADAESASVEELEAAGDVFDRFVRETRDAITRGPRVPTESPSLADDINPPEGWRETGAGTDEITPVAREYDRLMSEAMADEVPPSPAAVAAMINKARVEAYQSGYADAHKSQTAGDTLGFERGYAAAVQDLRAGLMHDEALSYAPLTPEQVDALIIEADLAEGTEQFKYDDEMERVLAVIDRFDLEVGGTGMIVPINGRPLGLSL